MKIYGVTGIDNTYQDIFDHGGDTNAAYVSHELDVRNSALWSQDLTAAKSCDYTKTATTSVMRRNFWYLEPVHARCKGTGDVYNTVPQLTQSSFAWWEAINSGTWPTFQDAKPAVGSPLVNAGENLGSTPLWTEAQWADGGTGSSWVLNQIKDVRNGVVTVSQWLQPNYHDAENNVRGCSGNPEIGVLERC